MGKLIPTTRERALMVMLGWAGRVFESGTNNHGETVEMIQRADDLSGVGYAWCQSTVNAAWRLASGGRIARPNGRPEIHGGRRLAGGTASVGKFLTWARERQLVVARPLRGDHVCFDFDGDLWPDHVGMVERVLRLGPVLYLRTVEGNTGPTGAVSDPGTGRDGVYLKRRVVRRSTVSFVRV